MKTMATNVVTLFELTTLIYVRYNFVKLSHPIFFPNVILILKMQLRIDFRFFNLEQPDPSGTIEKPYAHCIGEHLSINGLDFKLCGLLNNQHSNYNIIINQRKIIKNGSFQFTLIGMCNIKLMKKFSISILTRILRPCGSLKLIKLNALISHQLLQQMNLKVCE